MIDLSHMIHDMNNMKVKQSVEYNGKRYTLPFLVAKESLSTEEDTVKNRFRWRVVYIASVCYCCV